MKALSRRSRSRGGCARRRGADERSDAAPGFDDAGALELAIHTSHGVGIDAELHGQLPHGRGVDRLARRLVAIAARSPRSSCA